MESEFRFAELRAEGRELSGILIRYGDVALLPAFREEFKAGAFGNVGAADIVLNLQHDRGRPLVRTGTPGLTLVDSRGLVSLVATMPNTADGNDALELVRTGVLRGFSMEFQAERDIWNKRTAYRTVLAARLLGASLVDRPAYGDSVVSLRAAGYTEGRRLWL